MLTENTITAVKETVDIKEVVSLFVELKPKGDNLTGCCPFHNENTPSFFVNARKGFYKCFGCGVSGDAIAFVMKHERLDFIESIKFLAEHYNIPVEFERKQENKADVEDAKIMQSINKDAAAKYFDKLLNMPITEGSAAHYVLNERGISIESVIEFQLGYAPEGWKFLTESIINKGQFNQAIELGIIKSKNGSNYDFYRDRIMCPVHDHNGRIVGFSGRSLGKSDESKYLNSKESKLFKKDKVLYGLYQAQKAIKEAGKAYLVEGNFDVVSFHQKNICNTVAPCGTAFTESQAKLLKKFTDEVVIIYDGDDAGRKATLKTVDILIKEDFRIGVYELPISEDPDTFARKFEDPEELKNEITAHTANGIVYKATKVYQLAGPTPEDKIQAFDEVCGMLSLMSHEFKREQYIETICKALSDYKLKTKNFNVRIASILEEEKKKKEKDKSPEDDFYLPEGVDREAYFNYGFYELVDGNKTGYYFPTGLKSFEQKSNFVLKPLFHIYSRSDNKRLMEVDNGLKDGKRIVEMQSKNMLSLDQFSATLFDEYNYLFQGQKPHLLKIIKKIGDKFPLCYELKTLGWQPEGFFAFNNYIFNNSLIPFDDYGIVRHEDKNYFSPSSGQMQKYIRKEDDEYENDRYLTYTEAPIDFTKWADLMNKVYGNNGNLGIAFVFVALFRDIIFRLSNNCPFLYGYGQVQSGKSTWADSISNLFFKQMKAFNLNQGTDFAFFSRLGRFRNCPVVFNEFDEYGIKETWFKAFKSTFDGEGRERGKEGKKNKTEVMKVEAVVVLLGQYLSTKDDGSVLSRSIIAQFDQVNERTQEQKDNWQKLKEYEEQGLSGILVELMRHRDIFKNKYPENFHRILKEMKAAVKADKAEYKERIISNYTILATSVFIMKDLVSFPFEYEEFFEFCKNEVIRLSNLINESNALAGFWKTVEFLLDQNQIFDGWDFRIETRSFITIRENRTDDKNVNFDEPKKLLFIRMTNIHKLYSELTRRQTGTNGVNEQTLHLYINSQKGFLGNNGATKFKDPKTGKTMTTSCYVFDYDELGCNLERLSEFDAGTPEDIEGAILKAPEVIDLSGKPVLNFTLYTETFYTAHGLQVKKVMYTKCVSSDLKLAEQLSQGTKVKLTGVLKINTYRDKSGEAKEARNMTVEKIQIISNETPEGQTEEIPF